MLYCLSTNPPTLDTLRDEIETLPSCHQIPRWKHVKNLRYLDAVFREVMRVNSYLSIPMERVVAKSGATICGHYLPPGTVVGAQLGVVHQDTNVFGNQYPVEEFQPKRWLEATAAQRIAMEKGSIGFGAGKRSCLGRHIPEMEIKKVVPSLITRFAMTLRNEEAFGETGTPRHIWKKIVMRFEAIEKVSRV
jgi:cytochrome P450